MNENVPKQLRRIYAIFMVLTIYMGEGLHFEARMNVLGDICHFAGYLKCCEEV